MKHDVTSSVLKQYSGYVSVSVGHEQFRETIGLVVKQGGRIAVLGSGSGAPSLLALDQYAAQLCAIDDGATISAAGVSCRPVGYIHPVPGKDIE